MADEKPTLAARVRIKVGEAVEGTTRDGIDTVDVPREQWVDAARVLRDDEKFVRFIDLTVVDDVSGAHGDLRFEVHLVVYSMEEKRWGRLRTRTDAKLASVYGLYQAVHNYEREAFDMFGVVFDGHPSLTRILMPDGWRGHPLRRDEPLMIEPVDFTVTRDLYKT
jgi:NADH-quinone oxidoreductase subunit C